MLRGGERDRRGGRDAQHVDGAAHGAGAQYSHTLGQGAHYPLHTFQRGDLLLARNVNRAERYWPVRRNGATCTRLFFVQLALYGELCSLWNAPNEGGRCGPCPRCTGARPPYQPAGQALCHVLWTGSK